MKSLLTIALAVLFVTSLSSVVLAERTALSIDGRYEILGIYQENIDSTFQTLGSNSMDNRVEQKINLNVDADMTDNVSVHIGLEIDFAWADNDPALVGARPTEYTFGADDRVALTIDEAYIKIDELLMEELSITAGVMTVEYSLRDDGNAMFLSLPELGAFKATLDYDPLYVDILIGKLNEIRHGDDSVVGTSMSDMDLYAIAVEYYLENESKIQVIIFTITDKEQDISFSEYSAGVSYNVSDDFEIFAQFGGQGGEWGKDMDSGEWACNLGVEYTFSNVNLTPYVGISYQCFDGDSHGDDANWINLGDVDETIVLEADLSLRDHNLAADGSKILVSNYNALRIVGGCQINEKTALDTEVAFFSVADKDGAWGDLITTGEVLVLTETVIGTEIDVRVTHQLTDDLKVGLGIGYVVSGDIIELRNPGGEDNALIVIAASAVLTF